MISKRAIVLTLAVTLGGCMTAQAQQPHMAAALDSLRAARAELARALPNKGGHRERALRLIDQAIDETNAGIDFARRR